MEANPSGIRAAVHDLFDLYLGRGSSNLRPEGPVLPKLRRISAKAQPPKDEQFQADFLHLQSQFPVDYNQLQSITESFLVMLFVQCGSHTLQAKFLLFALRTLTRIGAVRWDIFLASLFRMVAMVETNAANGQSTSLPTSLESSQVGTSPTRRPVAWLRSLACNIMTTALEADLRPVSCFDMLCQVVQWINDFGQNVAEADNLRHTGPEQDTWLEGCLEVLRSLTDEDKCRVPYYALFCAETQLQVDYCPENEALLGLFLDVHRRRDRIALNALMLDQHLHCPTFATLRPSALTYTGLLGEGFSGEGVAISIQSNSLDWEKALRCLRHGLRTNPSVDTWRRLLVCAPRHRQQQQQPVAQRSGPITWTQPGFVFNSEMTCEAVVERIMNLMQPLHPGNPTSVSMTESGRWQEWLNFADLFYYFMRRGHLDFLEFIDKLEAAFASGEYPIIRSNHVTWLLAQVFRLDTVTQALSIDEKKVETVQKILSFMVDRPLDQASSAPPQSMLLEFVGSSQILRLWALNKTVMEHLTGNRMSEHIQKGRAIDEWWKKVERVLDYSSLDDRSMGMLWVLSHTMSQNVCEALMNWMRSAGLSELNLGQGERLTIVHETRPLPITVLSGLSLHLCMRLINQIEDQIFTGQFVPSIAMLESYVRLLLVAPQTLFQHHINGMMQKYQSGSGKVGISLILLELLNYRLIPLYRFHGKIRQLVFDIAKIIIPMKSKRGEHRLFRLAENLEMNLVLTMKDVMLIKKEKGVNTEFTETLNRVMVVSLAIAIKTRGIGEFDQMIVFHSALEQILAASSHTWSAKTTRHFPLLLQQALASRESLPLQTLQTWQQIETTVVQQCQQLLLHTTDASLVPIVVHNSQYRAFFLAGAWVAMDCRPESYNILNIGRYLKELSPEEVTLSIYALVDVLLQHMQLQLQHGHPQQELLLRATSTLAYLMWKQAILPFEIVLLALIDRDDDAHALRLVVGLLLDRAEFQQQRVQQYRQQHPQDHWLHSVPFQRPEPHEALGFHLAGKDRFPVFFDDMCLRALPVIPLIVYRLIENEATDTAERVLATYSSLLGYHPTRFTFIREILAYFYGHLPAKLVLRLLSILDNSKTPFSESFVRILTHGAPPYDYASMLLNLVNHVIPSLNNKTSAGSGPADGVPTARASKAPASILDSHRAFYYHQDPGSSAQLLLETSVVELLSLPGPPSQSVAALVQIAVRVPTPPTQAGSPANPKSPLSPSAANADNLGTASAPTPGSTISPFISPLVIQACGLLLAQLPVPFHEAYYKEVERIVGDCWWLKDSKKSLKEVDVAFGYSAWDPTWAVQDGTSSVIGNTVALFHAFASNLPFEWLENTLSVVNNQRPITSVAHLRLAFRMLGPLMPRFAVSRHLFAKTLLLLFKIMAEVFGRNMPVQDVSEVSDLVDFIYHAVMLEAQQLGGKARVETLALCGKGIEGLHPDAQHLFQHLASDHQRSIYAATHPKIVQRPASFFA